MLRLALRTKAYTLQPSRRLSKVICRHRYCEDHAGLLRFSQFRGFHASTRKLYTLTALVAKDANSPIGIHCEADNSVAGRISSLEKHMQKIEKDVNDFDVEVKKIGLKIDGFNLQFDNFSNKLENTLKTQFAEFERNQQKQISDLWRDQHKYFNQFYFRSFFIVSFNQYILYIF
jgi:hypothetical protein